MNSLSVINKMTSMEIAEVTGKLHHHIIRDIKDEIEKLKNAGINTETKFGLSERQDSTGRTIPYYELTKEGVLQLAARYDAVVRSKLIEMATRKEQQIDISRLTPELQMFNQLFNAVALSHLEIKQLQSTVDTIKDTIIHQPDNWREDVNKMCNRIAKAIGDNQFREVRTESYKLLEQRAGVNLTARLDNLKIRMMKEGRTKTEIKKANKLDIVEADKKLREIYAKILQEYTIKYCA